MAYEKKTGQWSRQVFPNKYDELHIGFRDIVITNVSLGPDLQGDARSVLLLNHVNTAETAQTAGEDAAGITEIAIASLTPGKLETVTVNIPLNLGENVCFRVLGDNAVHLFGHYTVYRKVTETRGNTSVSAPSRGPPRISQGNSASAAGYRHPQNVQASSSRGFRSREEVYSDDDEADNRAPAKRRRFLANN
ncbi:hypothetical protein R3P38DRAFT_3197597 [Favolaschia claudopus]|uniref:Nucleoplasmin-like domain-containing protein n=1 Tax=Favolaschia claudopus TaxID=2862362 RepID=A0AAW0B409_9AGAR